MKNIPLLLAIGLAVLTPGCGKKDEAAGPAGAAAQKKLKLAFVSNNAANFWTIARAGCNDAARDLGDVDVDFRIPSAGSAAEQQQILDDLVARGENGIAVSPIDPNNQTDFLNKIAGQALLICCDSDAAASKRVCYIGTDNEAAGEQAGNLIKEVLPNGGEKMFFVVLPAPPKSEDRMAGIQDTPESAHDAATDAR